ncbi:MAG: SPOR domain-containing protein [Rhodospirillales bacterium]
MPRPEDRADGGIAERLEFEPVERRKPGRKWGRLVAFLILVGVVSGGVWVMWGKEFVANQQQGDVPIIRADIAPIKVRPADPGGMDVPDRDKLVYNRLNGEGAGSEVEHLLPPPEEPMTLPENTAAVSEPAVASTGAAETMGDIAEGQPMALEPMALDPAMTTAADAPPPAPPAEEPTTSALDASSEPPSMPEPIAEAPATTETASNTPEPKPAPEPEPAPEPATQAAAETQPSADLASRLPTSDTYRIQLAALRSQDRAEAEWKRLRAAHTDLLGRLGLSIVRVDLGGDKGIFYRLRAGPLADAAAAKALCGELSTRNVGCLVVRPGS